MAERLSDKLTPCTPQEMFYALGNSWVQLFNERPKKESLYCLLAQWAVETGWGKSCHCWNIGNFRSREGDGRDYVFYECNELLSDATAQKYVSNAKPRSDDPEKLDAVITGTAKNGNLIVWFYPDSSGSRFRAYDTIEEGAKDYVSSLHDRFHKAWPAIVSGDPTEFIRQLRIQKYFTAIESVYSKTVNLLFSRFSKMEFDLERLPIVSDDEKERIEGLVALNLYNGFDETKNEV